MASEEAAITLEGRLINALQPPWNHGGAPRPQREITWHTPEGGLTADEEARRVAALRARKAEIAQGLRFRTPKPPEPPEPTVEERYPAPAVDAIAQWWRVPPDTVWRLLKSGELTGVTRADLDAFMERARVPLAAP